MAVKIRNVCKGSPAYRKGMRSGDTLVSFNGNEINDFLDYSFYAVPEETLVEFINKRGHRHTKKICFEGEASTLGLEFDSFLMDKQHSCKNKCIFCFVDQMPKGLRDTLYFKDDDSRLSFLFGNYITLTNLSEDDVHRIIKMHISPVNISVHTMNPSLRVKMMLNPNAGLSLAYIKKFADAGISMNTQLVLCPGINDGEELKYSLEELSKYCPAVQSIAAVPVGLTKYRESLYPLKKYTRQAAIEVLQIIDEFNDRFMKSGNKRIAFASDEFYLLAQHKLPDYDYYGDFCQLDNGVGLCALTEYDFLSEMNESTDTPSAREIGVVTGMLAYPLISELCKKFSEKYSDRKITVYGIRNDFFGEDVTVAGLVTAADMLAQLKEKSFCAPVLIIPSVMLKRDEDIFLDDTTLEEVQNELKTKVYKSEDGQSLCRLLFEV